jgi:hypothetical protein
VDSIRQGSVADGVGLLGDRSVAVVHEWFSAAGGSEKVFLSRSPISSRTRGASRSGRSRTPAARTCTSHGWRGHRCGGPRRSRSRSCRWSGGPCPAAVRRRVSSSHAFAHTVRLGAPGRPGTSAMCTPLARYVWSPEYDGRGKGHVLTIPRQLLKHVDRRLSSHVARTRPTRRRCATGSRRTGGATRPSSIHRSTSRSSPTRPHPSGPSRATTCSARARIAYKNPRS